VRLRQDSTMAPGVDRLGIGLAALTG